VVRCRGDNLLAMLAVAPAGGMLANALVIHPEQGYYLEQAALVAIGLVSLVISRGLLFYGYASLVPVLSMMYRQVGLGGNHSSLQYVPLAGVVIVAVFTLSRNEIFNYALWAATANGATVLIYHDIGKVVLWGWTALAAGLSMYICFLFNEQEKHQVAIRKQVETEREKQRGHLKTLEQRIAEALGE
jgi:hypothetical protein